MRTLFTLVTLSLLLTGCYDGHIRYYCQKYENWNKSECKLPRCEAEGECTKDLFTEDQLTEMENVIR